MKWGWQAGYVQGVLKMLICVQRLLMLNTEYLKSFFLGHPLLVDHCDQDWPAYSANTGPEVMLWGL